MLKDFRDNTIKELTKNGVGEKDAIGLLDQFIALELPKSDQNKVLEDPINQGEKKFNG